MHFYAFTLVCLKDSIFSIRQYLGLVIYCVKNNVLSLAFSKVNCFHVRVSLHFLHLRDHLILLKFFLFLVLCLVIDDCLQLWGQKRTSEAVNKVLLEKGRWQQLLLVRISWIGLGPHQTWSSSAKQQEKLKWKVLRSV